MTRMPVMYATETITAIRCCRLSALATFFLADLADIKARCLCGVCMVSVWSGLSMVSGWGQDGSWVTTLPLPRPANVRVSALSATGLTVSFHASLPWAFSSYLVRYVAPGTDVVQTTCAHVQSREAAGQEQACVVSGLSDALVYSIVVTSTLRGYAEPFLPKLTIASASKRSSILSGMYFEPIGARYATLVPVTPTSIAQSVGVCYADYAELAVEWLPPAEGPLSQRYRISYSILSETSEIVRLGGADSAHLVLWTEDIPHSGLSRDTWQRETIKGLTPGATYQLRVHTISPTTALFDPLGAGPVIATTRADRAGFLLSLNKPCWTVDHPFGHDCPYIMAAPYVRASDRADYHPRSLTMEAWVKITPQSVLEGQGLRRVAIMGNFYSVQRGLASAADPSGKNSGAMGHFGYGLYCDLQIPDGRWTCRIALGLDAGVDAYSSLRGYRCDAVVADWQSDTWTHIAASYDQPTGSVSLLRNGRVAASTHCTAAGASPPQILYEAPSPSIYTANVATGEGLLAAGLPMWGMGFAVGRLLVGDFARTSIECPPIFFHGQLDQVRLWSYARTAAEVVQQAMLDTLSVSAVPRGLLAYFPFDDPVDRGLCAQSLTGVTNKVTGATSDLLNDAKIVQATTDVLPIDKEPVLSLQLMPGPFPLHISRHNASSSSPVLSPSSTRDFSASNASGPSDGASWVHLSGEETVTLYLGDTLNLHAFVSDANPSDSVLMTLHVQGDFHAHPSGLVVVSEQARRNQYSLDISWSPLVRDTGKMTRMCLEAEGERFNPSRPTQIYASLPISRCINVYVPSCQVRAKLGDTLRSLAGNEREKARERERETRRKREREFIRNYSIQRLLAFRALLPVILLLCLSSLISYFTFTYWYDPWQRHTTCRGAPSSSSIPRSLKLGTGL